MPKPPPRRSVVIANAGCGKTWTLSTRFARWCLDRLAREGEASPERILALTFTRKAAGEILEAVVQRFSEAIDGDLSVLEALGHPSSENLRAAMMEFARAIPRLRLTTIDGFFNQLTRTFSNELGLPENWRVAEETEIRAARLLALERVLEDRGIKECFGLVKDGMPKSTVLQHLETELLGSKGEMATSVLGIYRRTLLGRGFHAWITGSEHQFTNHLIRNGDDLTKLAQRLSELSLPLKKDGDPVQAFVKKRDLLVRHVHSADWDALLEENFVHQAGLPGGTRKHGSTAIPSEWTNVVQELAHHAMACVSKESKDRLFDVAEFLTELDAACWQAQAESSAYSFGDIASRLAVHGKLEDWSWEWLQYRLDTQIDDLALDEFQDTSVDQMRVLDRLMQEVNGSDDERRFLLVGDPKQSIYGWRGGTPELIEKVREKYSQSLEADAPLKRSFRSCPLLMDAVSHIFKDLERHAAEVDPDSGLSQEPELVEGVDWPDNLAEPVLSRASSLWMQGWNSHESAREDLPGLMTWSVAEYDKSAWQSANARAVATLIEQRQKLRPTATIGVLARTNKELAEIYLACKDLGIASVSMEGKSDLLDSLLVQQVLALFRMADHPDDELAHYLSTRWVFPHIASSVAPDLHLEPAENISSDQRSQVRNEIASKIRRQLIARGAVGFVSDIHRAVCGASVSIDPRELDRLAELISVSRVYEALVWPRPLAFVEAIEGHRQGNQRSSGIRLMTIHGSKGLGFDEVVLTGAKKSLGLLGKNEVSRFMTYEEDPIEGTQVVLPGPNGQIRPWFPSLAAVASEIRVRNTIDPISMAYVALTRAKTAVHIVVQPFTDSDRKKGSSVQRSFAWLVAKSYSNVAEAWMSAGTDNPGLVWALEDHGQTEREEGAEIQLESDSRFVDFDHSSLPVEGFELDRPPLPKLDRKARIGLGRGRSASATHDRRDWSALLEIRNDAVLDRGTILHERFRLLQWIDGSAPSRQTLANARRSAERLLGRVITDTSWESANAEFGQALQQPQIREWFVPEAHNAAENDLEVRNEFPVLTRDGDGRVIRGRLDRLVLRREAGQVVEAWVMDHKSGAIALDDDSMRDRIQHYAPQLEAYAKVVMDRWGLTQQQVHCVLLFFERGEAKVLPPAPKNVKI
ncbi:MAG: hypothetical protein CMJ28_01825 [Phycisphaerae bacterium]|nr:hypothetical protein [Phycisphaerae bacterium]